MAIGETTLVTDPETGVAYPSTEIAPPVSNVTTAPAAPANVTYEPPGVTYEPDGPPAAAAKPDVTQEDPLDVYKNEDLIKAHSFDPIQYFNEFGRGFMKPEKLDRLSQIFAAKTSEGVSAGGLVSEAGRFAKEGIFPKGMNPVVGAATAGPRAGIAMFKSLWHLAKGAAEVGERAVVRPALGAPLAIAGVANVNDWVQKGFDELAAGTEADAVGFAEGLRTFLNKAQVAARMGKPLPPEDAKKLLIDWAARSDMVREAQQGKGAAFNMAETLKSEGIDLDPEAVQNVAAGGPVSLVLFGAGFKAVNAVGKAILTAPTRTAAMEALARLRKAAPAARAAATAEELAAGRTTQAFEAAKAEAVAGQAGAAGAESAQAALKRSQDIWNASKTTLADAEAELTAAEANPALAKSPQIMAQRLAGARQVVTQAADALKAGPRNLERETALQAAQSTLAEAEAAARGTKWAQSLDFLNQAKAKLDSIFEAAPTQVVGRGLQAAGVTTEAVAGAAKLGARSLRLVRPLGLPVGSLLGAVPKAVAGGIERAGAAVKQAGAAITAEAPGLAARRAQDIVNASADIFKGAAAGTAIDFGFAVGTSKSEDEAQAMLPGVVGALGAVRGLARGGGRIVAGEVIEPKTGAFKQRISSPAYGENTALDKLHADAMSKSSPELQNQVNMVREIGKKIGNRLYVMPDKIATKALLDDIWRQQNPGKVMPEDVSRQNAADAEHNGISGLQVTGPDGKPQTIEIINDPAAIAHEGIGHALERVLPEDINASLDNQIRSAVSPENWEASGNYYARRLLGEEAVGEGKSWRDAISSMTNLDPDTYLAREMRAENLDVAFKNRGEAFATSPGLYRGLMQFVGTLAEKAGLSPTAVSAELGFPVSIEAMRRGEKALRGVTENEPQQILLQAKAERLREANKPVISPAGAPPPVAPPVEAKTGEPAAKARELAATESEVPPAPTAEFPTPQSPKDIATIVADAIDTGGAVRLLHHGAPGEPSTALYTGPKAETVRGAVQEAFRNMPQSAKELFARLLFPEKVVGTKEKGPQVQGYMPEIFAANAHRVAEALAKAGHTYFHGYAIDLATKTFTPEAWQALYTDLGEFVKNQKAGLTGAGEALKLPADVTAAGYTAPTVEGAPGAKLPQNKADVINMLFGFKIPATARMIEGKMPQNIAGQKISLETLPGRVSAKAGAPFKAPFAGEAVREVNPVREQIAALLGKDNPELFQAWQHFNVRDIVNAEAAPEVPEFRGKSLTLAAGFQPGKPGIIGIGNEEGVKYRKVKDLSRSSHLKDLGEAGLGSFRYVIETKTLFWWSKDAISETIRANVKNRLEERGYPVEQEKAIEISGFKEAMGQFQPGKPGLIGIVDDEGVKYRRVSDLSKTSHFDEFGNAGTNEIGSFRYVPDIKTLFWWFKKETPKEARDAVKSRLEERGYPVEHEREIQFEHVSKSWREAHGQFQPAALPPEFAGRPVKESANELTKFTPEAWSAMTKDYQGKYVGGLTGLAYDIGSHVKDMEDVSALANTAKTLSAAGTEAMRAGQFDQAMSLISRAQAAREAYETATNSNLEGTNDGGSVPFIRKHFDPNFEPPLPLRPVKKAGLQFSPSDDPRAVDKAAVRDDEGKIWSGVTHGDAMFEATKAGSTTDLGDFDTGFLDKQGKWLTRAEAFKRAEDIGQLPTMEKSREPAIQGNMARRGLESTTFEQLRQFEPKEEDFYSPPEQKLNSEDLKAMLTKAEETRLGKPLSEEYAVGADYFKPDDADQLWGNSFLASDGKGILLEIGEYHDDVLEGMEGLKSPDPLLRVEEFQYKTGVIRLATQSSMRSLVDYGNGDLGISFSKAPTSAQVSGIRKLLKQESEPGYRDVEKNSMFNTVSVDYSVPGEKSIGMNFNYPADQGKILRFLNNPFAEEFKGQGRQFQPPKTKEFQNWFADSKVIDEQGDPLRVFHGTLTPANELKILKGNPELFVGEGIYFSDNAEDVNKNYATPEGFDAKLRARASGTPVPTAAAIYPAFLSLKNPAVLIEPGREGYETDSTFFNQSDLKKVGVEIADPSISANDLRIQLKTGDAFNYALRKLGFDGVKMQDVDPKWTGVDTTVNHYIVFDENQVRPWQSQPQPGPLSPKEVAPKKTESIFPRGIPQPQRREAVPEELVQSRFPAAAGGQTQMAPRQKESELKLKPGTQGASKAWVLPSGKVEQLGGQWHHAWLDEHPDVAKRYGLTVPPFKGNDAEGVREDALKAGFTRINYMVNGGALSVETKSDNWKKVRPVIEDLIDANINKVDSVSVHLFDANARMQTDGLSARLFDADSNREKMERVVEAFDKSRRGVQFEPSPFATSEVVAEELKKIRAGTIGGQSFDAAGNIWMPPSKPVDLVSLASVNLPLKSATPENIAKALHQFADLLGEPDVVPGVYAFSKDGEKKISVDVNVMVPQEFRANTLRFAKANDQVEIWDAKENHGVAAGGSGDTKLQDVAQIMLAMEDLTKGKPVDVKGILEAKPAKQEAQLPGFEGKEYSQVSMTRAEKAKTYPEAVITRKADALVGSDIISSPLAKAAGSREAAVKSFAQKLVEFAKEYADSPEYKSGLNWYKEFTPMLKKEFGKDAGIMAEFLAATSPQNNPTQNFAYAVDALTGFKSGRYDKLISLYNEGLRKLEDGSLQKLYERDVLAGKVKNPPATPTEATYQGYWVEKHKLLPVGASGKKFGVSSAAVMKVLARRWFDQTAGPKTQNFVLNLLGKGKEATIDVWADRTMRRIGYEGFKDRWRILPENAKGVSDVDFNFAQDAFRMAAGELKVDPMDLQGGLWFAEKSLWSQRGWGRLDLGDYRKEIKKLPMLKKGIAQREIIAQRKSKGKVPQQIEILPR